MKRKTTNSPYPVLYPEDPSYAAEQGYENAVFDVSGDPEVTVDERTHNLWIKFDFCLTQETLKKLVESGDASYYVNIECSRTYYRKPVVQSQNHFEIEIPYTEVSGSLEIFVGIVAQKDISRYHASGFAPRFGFASFDIGKGDILAAGTGWNVELEELDGDATPYIYVARDENEHHAALWVDGSNDELTIFLRKDVYDIYFNRAKTDKFRNLFVALVMKPAILSALQVEILRERANKKADAPMDVQGKRWLRKLTDLIFRAMERDGYSWDIDTVRLDEDREPNTLSFAVDRVLADPFKKAMVDINTKL